MTFPLVVIALGVGVLIGSVGVGGVALPPLLMWLSGFDAHLAAGTSSWSFLFTGVVGTWMYARGKAVPWRQVGYLSLGIVPAAVLGAAANHVVPERFALLPLAVLVCAAGLNSLFNRRAQVSGDGSLPRPWACVGIGAAVGFCSSITGTGGPVILMPILLTLGVPALTAVAASQVVQIPLVVAAVAGYAANGSVDFARGTLIGLIAAVGVVGGAMLAMRLPGSALQRFAAVALVSFGAVLLATSLN